MLTTNFDTLVWPVVTRADYIEGMPQGQWTYDTYAQIADDYGRLCYEVVDGVLYQCVSPGTLHQSVVGRFIHQFFLQIEEPKIGRFVQIPFDVELAPYTVVQPDMIVVLNDNMDVLLQTHCKGTPNLIIEVLSPGTAAHDWQVKYPAYEKAGVPELWITDPYAKNINLFLLVNGQYQSQGVFQGGLSLPSLALPSLPVKVEQFFA